MDEAPKIGSIPKTVLDSWQASIRPATSVASSIRPQSPRPPASGHSTVARRRVRALDGTPQTDVDFAIENLIGSGGMGMVYQAAQISLGRKVALKTLSDSDTEIASRQEHLREEALIAGQLDHPNIVPVYDLATDERGRLFYTMKRVRGTAWSHLLPRQNLDERLGVFQRICDAIAFAHSRGVIHRDLKPANVMLGAFGEVTVMDWGVACTVRGVDDPYALGDRAALCGTPAYMPPEMARGDTPDVGCASDIYLLGAILYELLEDHAPRSGPDAIACVEQAAENFIEPPRRDDELTRVAMRAMSARPGDRFASVTELQAAVRECVAHLESIRLARSAEDDSREGESTGAYPAHARAIFGFEQALARWPDHAAARAGMMRARLAYARSARAKGDFELALSQLDAGESTHAADRAACAAELTAQRQHRRRLRLFVRATAGLAAALALGAAAFGFIVREKNIALNQQQAEILQQKSEIAVRLEETRRSDRTGLITLLRAQHAGGEYEAAVASALRLREDYGFDFNAEPELRQMARESVWMNPWRATMETGVQNPLRLILTEDSPDLYVVGKNEIAVVDVAQSVIRRRISLPSPVWNGELVQVGAGGSLWCAQGMKVLRYDGTNWIPAIQELGIPLDKLPASKSHAISGLLISHGDRRMAVGIDGLWLACRESEKDSWKFASIDEHWLYKGYLPPPTEGCLIRDTPEGKWITWRPAQYVALIMPIESGPFAVRTHYENRGIPVLDAFIDDRSLHLVGMTIRGTVFPSLIESAARRAKAGAGNYWAPETNGEWQTPITLASVAAASPRRILFAFGGKDGELWMGRPWPDQKPQRACRTTATNTVAIAVDEEQHVFTLSRTGQVRRYDLRTFTPNPAPPAPPTQASPPADGTMPRDVRNTCRDPRGEFVALENVEGIWIQDLRDKSVRLVQRHFQIPGCGRLCFTSDGERLAAGAAWTSEFFILERNSWKPLNADQNFYGAEIHAIWVDGVSKIFVVGGKFLTRFDATSGQMDWSKDAGYKMCNLMHLVPAGLYDEPPSAWVQTYHGEFVRMSLRDGTVFENRRNPTRENIVWACVSDGQPYSVFMIPRKGFILNWRGDMRPLTTDLIGGSACESSYFSSDGKTLFATYDGQSVQIPLPGRENFARLEPLMTRLFGPDSLEARAGRIAASAGKEAP